MSSPWRAARAAMLVGLSAYGLLVARFNFVCDDAFISFRYARNLADGLGLRYNLGVEPPVEGYSNFLWVLLMMIARGVQLSNESKVFSSITDLRAPRD